MPLPSSTGKIVPAQLDELAHLIGVQHHAQPGVVSITQSTELGTVYTNGSSERVRTPWRRHTAGLCGRSPDRFRDAMGRGILQAFGSTQEALSM